MMRQVISNQPKRVIDYQIIKPLSFKVIRKPDDGFYKMVDNSVRRNLSWKTEVIHKMSTLFDLGEIVMLSRVHFLQCKIMNIKIEISEFENGPFIELTKEIIVVTGNIKVVKCGNLPCRYFRVTVLKGSPLQDYSKIECYGLTINKMQGIYDEDDLDLLMFNPYSFVYNYKEGTYNTNSNTIKNDNNSLSNSNSKFNSKIDSLHNSMKNSKVRND